MSGKFAQIVGKGGNTNGDLKFVAKPIQVRLAIDHQFLQVIPATQSVVLIADRHALRAVESDQQRRWILEWTLNGERGP